MNVKNYMAGKRVMVTGSGTGIGKGIAVGFAKEGADVAIHYSRSEKGAIAVVDEIKKYGVRAEMFKANFENVDEIKKMAEDAIEFLGGIDVLVNNAGIQWNMPFEKVTVKQFDTVYHVNIRAMFFATQSVVEAMSQSGGGAVVNVSSLHAFAGMKNFSVYTGTKGAIVSFTRTLAMELIERGIRVNGIAPGIVEVESNRETYGEYDAVERGRKIPVGFLGQPSDIANAALFLASDASRFILGQTLRVDGGSTAFWLPTEAFRESRNIQLGKHYMTGDVG
jgi:NAD(P)-dependent dehydrogenase (short-subunit alcohol dehydrogenase family)